ncbi:hypothetical protein B0J12DRAFT_686277 [Macrophomina phaseolina]|uniref:Secreted protein n=1 Tax=Macrophomina phaseolina TaxID=35725 RepID=A0ABQ8FT42_9PEZI|nr:hypothetical protein B0J12DRAFT_686277 [Macrophomina phaseolina]
MPAPAAWWCWEWRKSVSSGCGSVALVLIDVLLVWATSILPLVQGHDGKRSTSRLVHLVWGAGNRDLATKHGREISGVGSRVKYREREESKSQKRKGLIDGKARSGIIRGRCRVRMEVDRPARRW